MEATHPTRERLEAFLSGGLAELELRQIEDHVAICDTCCDVLRTVRCEPLLSPAADAETRSWIGDTKFAPATPYDNQLESQIPPELLKHPRYHILRTLGAGGMGVVYEAEHRLMQRRVALKVMNRRFVGNPVAVERFRLEVRGAASLSHKNIVTAHDAEQAGDWHFLVMEFIDGESLYEIVTRRGQLSPVHACNYIFQAARGLQHAHERGMVHRDIKPHNLMRTRKGTVKILDFGLARFVSQQVADANHSGLTSDGVALGTPDFIAPEQARDSKNADIRADIYSLGCTMYFLLGGRVPFPAGLAIDKIVAHVEHQATPLSELRNDLPDAVTAIVERMMAKDPADRYQSPDEVADALRPFAKPGWTTSPRATRANEGATELGFATEEDATDAEGAGTHNADDDTNDAIAAGAHLTDDLERPAAVVSPIPSDPFPAGELPDLLDMSGLATAAPLKNPLRPAAAQRRPFPQPPVLAALAALLASLVLVAGIALMFWLESSDDVPPVPIPIVSNQWVEMIAAIDPRTHGVVGNWTKRGGELHVDASPDARLRIPFQPSHCYDLEVQFTRVSGSDSVALMFAMGQGQASFEVDGWGENLAGIQNIDKQTFMTNASRSQHDLQTGRRHTMSVRVRKDRVDGYLDGERIATYEGDGSKLSLMDAWSLPKGAFGVGAYDAETVFHSIRVRNVRPQ